MDIVKQGQIEMCKVKTANYFREYLNYVPLPMAIERSLECNMFAQHLFRKPVLDLGCGDGRFASILFNTKIDLGVDINSCELKKCKETDMYEEILQCRAQSIPKDNESFNTIISNSVLEHIENIDLTLKEAYRLLKKDGVLYVTVPTDLFETYSNLFQLLQRLRMTFLADLYRNGFNKFWRHYHAYTIEAWIKKFHTHGFCLVSQSEYCSQKIGLLNDFLDIFSLPSFIQNKIFSVWFLFPRLRRLYAPVLYNAFKKAVPLQPSCNKGGLVFYKFRKTL